MNKTKQKTLKRSKEGQNPQIAQLTEAFEAFQVQYAAGVPQDEGAEKHLNDLYADVWKNIETVANSLGFDSRLFIERLFAAAGLSVEEALELYEISKK